MPRGKRTRGRLSNGEAPFVPAHWQEDHRSKLHSVMQRLLGRCAIKGDLVFEISVDHDEALLNCDTLQPPRCVRLSIEEHIASLAGQGEDGLEGESPGKLLEQLKVDCALTPRSRDGPPDTPREAPVELGIDLENGPQGGLSNRRTVKKSVERRLSLLLLDELVDDGILEVNPVATSCATAYKMGPNFIPRQPAMHNLHKMKRGCETADELNEMLDAILSGNGWNRGTMKAELNEALKSFIGRNVRKGDVIFEEDECTPPRVTLRIPPLNFVADYEHDGSDVPYNRKAAENQLSTTAIEHFKEMLSTGDLASAGSVSGVAPDYNSGDYEAFTPRLPQRPNLIPQPQQQPNLMNLIQHPQSRIHLVPPAHAPSAQWPPAAPRPQARQPAHPPPVELRQPQRFAPVPAATSGFPSFEPPGRKRPFEQPPAAGAQPGRAAALSWAARPARPAARPALRLAPPVQRPLAEQPQPAGAKNSALRSLELWCEERDADFEEEMGMTSDGSWTATIKLPACHAINGEEMSATGSAANKAGAREAAAAGLLEQATLRSRATQLFGDIDPPDAKRPRLATIARGIMAPRFA